MARKAIVWTDTANFQKREIFKCWTKRNGSPEYSKKLRDMINARLALVQNNPESFLKSNFDEIYMTIISHFCIYYKIKENEILINAFWDSRQDPEELYLYLTTE
jgi:plasmid stabilization system protein ParE